MAKWLVTLDVLAKVLGLVPSTHTAALQSSLQPQGIQHPRLFCDAYTQMQVTLMHSK